MLIRIGKRDIGRAETNGRGRKQGVRAGQKRGLVSPGSGAEGKQRVASHQKRWKGVNRRFGWEEEERYSGAGKRIRRAAKRAWKQGRKAKKSPSGFGRKGGMWCW